MPIYVVPKALRDKLGEEATEALVEFLRQVSEQNRVDLFALAEERLERRVMESSGKLREEFTGTWAELRTEIGAVRAELREEIARTSAELREEIAKTSTELRTEIGAVRAELREEIARTSAELRGEMTTEFAKMRVEIANTQADLIKWMFIFWVGQVAVILGILFAWFRG